MGIQIIPHRMEQVNLDEDLELYCVEFKEWDGSIFVFEEFSYSLCGIISRFKSQVGRRYNRDRILCVTVERDGCTVDLWNL